LKKNKRRDMSKGILQLAATGQVALQLEYRELRPQLPTPDAGVKAEGKETSSNMSPVTGTFELIYGEY
jgi:hypothetical protein